SSCEGMLLLSQKSFVQTYHANGFLPFARSVRLAFVGSLGMTYRKIAFEHTKKPHCSHQPASLPSDGTVQTKKRTEQVVPKKAWRGLTDVSQAAFGGQRRSVRFLGIIS
ncbi:MAG: hypothetical protein IJX39_05670, partial [Clostridia bacterium]|nr:hypothetical protein [Clostridia bacterium]